MRKLRSYLTYKLPAYHSANGTLNLSQVARRMGCSRQYIHQIVESGQLSPGQAFTFYRTFKLDIAELQRYVKNA